MVAGLPTEPEPEGAPVSRPSVGLRDVAREAGVSVATASFALNGNPRCAAATRVAVHEAARRLGYQKSAAISRALTAIRSRRREDYRDTVACISGGAKLDAALEAARPGPGGTRTPFEGWTQMALFARGLRTRAEEIGVRIDHFSLAEEAPAAIASVLRARGIRAAVLFLRDVGIERAQQTVLALQDIGLVILGPCPLNPPPGNVIGCDLFAAGRRTFFEAWRAGYRRVVLSPPHASLDPERRFSGGLASALGTFAGHPPIEVLGVGENSEEALAARFAQSDRETCFVGLLSPDITRGDGEAGRGNRPGWLSWHANLIPQPGATGIDQRDEEQARCAVEEALGLSERGGDVLETRQGIELLLEPGWRKGNSAPDWRNDHLNLLPDAPFEGAGGPWRTLALGRVATADFAPSAPWRQMMPLPRLRPGTWKLHGIPFRMAARRGGEDAVVVLMASSTHPREGNSALPGEVCLPVGQHVRAVYFLHACGYVRGAGEVARYAFRYASGQSWDVPVVPTPRAPCAGWEAANIQDWHPSFPQGTTGSAHPVCLLDADLRPGETGYLYVYRWVNPHPRRRLAAITIKVDPDAPCMLALCGVTLQPA